MFFKMAWTMFFLNNVSVWGFTLAYPNEAHFPTHQIRMDVAGDDCFQAGFNSPDELLHMLEQAMDEYWNRIPTCALELSKGSVRNDVQVESDALDEAVEKANENTILFGCSNSTELFGPATLAVASIDVNHPSRGIVLINNTSSRFANLSLREKWATLAHEVGHAFGLGHSADPVSLMYYSIGNKIQEKLSLDDYDACTYLYPQDGPLSCAGVAFVGPSKGVNKGKGWSFWPSFGMGFLIILFFSYISGRIFGPTLE